MNNRIALALPPKWIPRKVSPVVAGYVVSLAMLWAPASSGVLLFSEIMYNPAGPEDDWEWIELLNTGGTAVDLTGYVLDDINSLAHTSANISGGSIAPGGAAVLYNADDVSAATFSAAWTVDANLIGVSGWGQMALNNTGDQIGLWSSFADYSGDHQTHANTVAGVAYDDSNPWPSDNGASSIFVLDPNLDNADGGNWRLSADGIGGAFTSSAAGTNSGADVGSPGIVPTLDLVFSEVMYNPASAEDDWEWVEIVNRGEHAVDLSGLVFDDENTLSHSSANVGPGVIGPGETAVLYNADDLSEADFEAAWGMGINLVPVSNWSINALNNSGDRIALWASFGAYVGDHQSHTNAFLDLLFDDAFPWPADDGHSSIYLTDLGGLYADGSLWALSMVGEAGAYQSLALGGNSGTDIGSPGYVDVERAPEPLSLLLVSTGLAALGTMRRRRRDG